MGLGMGTVTRIANPFRCDVCAKLRESDTNHWLLGFLDERAPQEVPPVALMGLHIYPWDEAEAATERAAHLCGQSCALKWAERELPKLNALGAQRAAAIREFREEQS